MATFPLHYRHIAEHKRGEKAKRRIRNEIAPTTPVPLQDARAHDRLILQLISRDGHGCYICRNTPAEYQVEHIIPRVHGGTDHLANLALACDRCNARKGAKIISFTIAERMPCLWL